MPYRYAKDKSALLTRLRRVEGQVRGIARMVEDDKYCVDVVNQIQAAVSALERVGMSLLADHIRGCVRDAVASETGEETIEELLSVIERLVKTRPAGRVSTT